jgi:hypothetical protein
VLISELPQRYVAHPRPVATVAERLQNYTVVDDCHIWNGWCQQDGYGRMKVRGKDEYVHRLAYVQHVGLIPDGMAVGQLCDNRRCINPDHLYIFWKRKLTIAQVLEIRQRYVTDTTASHASLAIEYGVAKVVIHCVLSPHLGLNYSSVPDLDGYVWRPSERTQR